MDLLLQEHGHLTAHNKQISLIENALENLLNEYFKIEKNIIGNKYDIFMQTNEMIKF